MSSNQPVFWAEQIASNVLQRKKYRFVGKKIPRIKKGSVKSSSSLSGALHIGRLSDIIRGEAVFHALKEKKFPAEFIYVTEDMDPLRKIPKGVPSSFEKFIGFPVSDVPDPFKCHKSYGEHFKEEFLKVFNDFLFFEPKVFSMREEYRKGAFNDSIIKIVKEKEKVKEIIEKVQGSTLPPDWSPWKPICDNCGNLQTTVVTGVEGDKITYVCKDYSFENAVAKGCGYEGTSNLRKPNGKLVWKSEWAVQWKRWNVVSEGAGKEYESKNSAFWVNAEICERVLGFPMPEPIFYEHLVVDGVKMSASLGNVIYPADWLQVSRPETLKFLYLKKIMKSRSFSWRDIPSLELELDRAAESISSTAPLDKELAQAKKILEFSKVKNREIVPLPVDYKFAAELSQLFDDEKKIFSVLKEMKHLTGKEPKDVLDSLRERLSLAGKWVEKYAPDEFKINFLEFVSREIKGQLSPAVVKLFPEISKGISKAKSAEEVQKNVFAVAKENNLPAKEFFQTLYLVLIGKPQGPKLGNLVFALGKSKVLSRLKEISF